MIRLILFGIFFVILTNKRQLDAARGLYDQSSDHIQSSIFHKNNQIISNIKSTKDYIKQQHKILYSRDKSPTYIQSRRFHSDQFARDIRELGQPSSFISPISSSYYYTYASSGSNIAISIQEGCRLTNNFCSNDYQCCSGKCRCTKWSIMGKMSCWKKCF